MNNLIKEQVHSLLLTTSLSHAEIGKQFGLSRGPIQALAKALGIVRPNIRIKNLRSCQWCKKDYVAKGLSPKRPDRGKYCSKQCYTDWQLSDQFPLKGEAHPSWKDGGKHEKETHRLRHTRQWAEWRKAVYERDKYKCKFCGVSKHLEPHHIYPRRDFPDRIFDITNGITLCRACHIPTIKREYEFVGKCEAALMHVPMMR